MRKVILCLMAGIVISLSGCEFLDEEPKTGVASGNFYKTESDAVAATNGIYEFLSFGLEGLFDPGYGGVYYNQFWIAQDICSDNAEWLATSLDHMQLSDFSFDANNLLVESLWWDYYKTINLCNTILAYVPPIQMDEPRKDNLLAEARFFRALMYLDLVRMWGDVPYFSDPVTDGEAEGSRARVDKAIIYDAIIEDLDWAEEHFLDEYRKGNGRPDQYTANALEARVYLTRGMIGSTAKNPEDLQKAIDCANIVINSGKYHLWPDYADIFKLKNSHSGEIILGINFSSTLDAFKANQFPVVLLPTLKKGKDGLHNTLGLLIPTDNLYDSFDDLDRRKSVTFLTSYTFPDGIDTTFQPYVSKYWDAQAEPKGHPSDADFIAIRLAEMYLIVAEAGNEINNGPNQAAYDAINVIRKRARFDGIAEQDVLPDLSGLDYTSFRDAVLLERQREFVMEGHRWFDLTRFHQLIEKVEASSKPNATPQDFHYLMPIPQRDRELDFNLGQNPGY